MHRLRWWILAVLCLSVLIVVLDDTIIIVALPVIQRDLGATTTQLEWTLDAYLVIFAGLLLAAGSLGDRYGRKAALLAGLMVFGAGSLSSALSPTIGRLIASRALMGVGAAFIMPTTLSILIHAFPDRERTRAIGIWSGIVGVGVAVGPVTGGALLVRYWWGSVFLVNVPMVIITVAAGMVLIGDSRDPQSHRIDVPGALLSILGLGVLVLAITEAPSHGWTNPRILFGFAAAALLLVTFIMWERSCDHPMVPRGLFKKPRFSSAAATLMLMFFALLGLLFVLTQLLQVYDGYSPFGAGLRTAPVALAIMVGALLGAGLTSRSGATIPVAGGLLLLGAGLAVLALFGDRGYPPLLGGILIVGFGMGLAQTPATDAVMGSVPPDRAGVGSALNDTTRQIGAALGVAVIGSVLASRYAGELTRLQGIQGQALPTNASDSLSAALALAARIAGTDGAQLENTARLAFSDGLRLALLVAAGAAIVAAFLAIALLPAHEREAQGDRPPGGLIASRPEKGALREWLMRPTTVRRFPKD